MMRKFTAMILVTSILAGAASANPPLREVAEIDDGLLAVGLADEIRKNCDTISPRMIRAYRFVKSLEAKAVALGYTKKEIRAYTKSREEKDRMRARGETYLAENGVDRTQPDTFCALGRAEIENSTMVGALLIAR